MGGQMTRKLGKELLIAFQRRIGVGVANVSRNEFPHFGETISPLLRNHFAIPAKPFRNDCETVSETFQDRVSVRDEKSLGALDVKCFRQALCDSFHGWPRGRPHNFYEMWHAACMCMGLSEWSGDRALRHAATATLFLDVFKGVFHGYFVRTFLSTTGFLCYRSACLDGRGGGSDHRCHD
jgi:hypothetical protein